MNINNNELSLIKKDTDSYLFETTQKNIEILRKKLQITKNLVNKKNSTKDETTQSSLTKYDIKKLKKLNKLKLQSLKKSRAVNVDTGSTTREAKLCLFTDEQNDEYLIDDDLNLKDESDVPKNDYCQHFVDTNKRPQNFIRDPGLQERFEEYPKLKELIKLKDELIAKTNVPIRPMYIKSDLLAKNGADFPLAELVGTEFDVILVEPPLHEYQILNKVQFNRYYTWDEVKSIDVGSIASPRSFIFLWCGSGDGLDKGRECLKKWGFRRCEDICWIKTNKKSPNRNRTMNPTGIFQRTKEHCLMGIKGTVKRSSDTNFIHTNIDIDLIISEEPEEGVAEKPEEIFNIIEHFCLGRRRLYLFGRDNTIRNGWLTVGPALSETNFDKDTFRNLFDLSNNGNLTGSTDKIELLRPKTPPMKAKSLSMTNSVVTGNDLPTSSNNSASIGLNFTTNNNNISIIDPSDTQLQ